MLGSGLTNRAQFASQRLRSAARCGARASRHASAADGAACSWVTTGTPLSLANLKQDLERLRHLLTFLQMPPTDLDTLGSDWLHHPDRVVRRALPTGSLPEDQAAGLRAAVFREGLR